MGAGLTIGFLLALALGTPAADEQSLYFGFPGSTVTVPELSSPEGPAPLSLEFRFKTLSKLRTTSRILSRWDLKSKDPDKGSFSVDVGAGKIIFAIRNAEGKTKTLTGRSAWREGKWHHVAAVWTGEEALVYLNGKKIGSMKLADFGPLAPTKLPLVIGPPVDPKARRPVIFDGFIGDVAVWNVARDAESVGSSVTGSEAGLAAYFSLRQKAAVSKVRSPAGSNLEGALSPGLARVGWCATPTGPGKDADEPFVHLFSYALPIANAVREVVVTNQAKKQPGIVWQDKATGKVSISWIAPTLEADETVALPGLENATLVAATADPRGNLYYLMIEKSPRDRPESVALKSKAFLTSPEGKVIRETDVDMTKGAFNVYNYGGRWTGSMAYSKGTVCVIVPRTMYRSGDGLRHQAAIAATFSADLAQVQRLGHTSSHSFGNLLTVNTRGEFIGLDLGDNYPRGVHLHRIGRGSKNSRIVFTYKTAHGTSARGGSPVYPEISTNGKTFYKWSNDNRTYSELGGVVEGRVSYSVVFSTDRSPEGKVLDNSRIGVKGEPRDLVLLRIVKNFERAPGGSEVSDALMAGLPKGAPSETGGFYDFGGKWKPQRVTGMIWLTNYTSGEAAHAPQPVRRKDGSVFIFWEKTGPEGASLYAMTIDESGKKTSDAIRLGSDLRLAREAVPARIGDRIFYLARDARGGKSRLCFVTDN